jgi:predicted dehydrogenase
MSGLPVRLALVGYPEDVSVWAKAAECVRGVRVTVIADSMRAAADDAFDAVVAHAAADARLAAESGKHVLMDGPAVESREEAERIGSACRAANVCFSIGRPLRHTPANQLIMDRLSAGKLGAPGLLRVHRWCSVPRRSLCSRIYGDVDLAIQIFSSKPADIYALGRWRDEVPDYVQIHLGFPKGGMAVLDFSAGLPTGQGYDSLSLIGSTGAAYADDHHNTHLLFAGDRPTALVSDQGGGHRHELQAFVDAIESESGTPEDEEESWLTHQVIEGIRGSFETGKVIRDQGGRYESV